MGVVPAALLDIGESFHQRYQPVLFFDGWKVAMLRHFEAVAAERLERLERHRNTDEVFVLTSGRASLILGDGGDGHAGMLFVQPMRLHVAYNVRCNAWHHVIMSEDAHIVIFERAETGRETTDYLALTPEALAELRPKLHLTD
jgi:ureidoglycolate hydrolase